MNIIARDFDPDLASMLEAFEHPAILVGSDYRILATNGAYRDSFGAIDPGSKPFCYQVSHGYQVPCDQAGENCPLAAASASHQKERVLHIHQTPRGREHIDVEMLPILNADGELKYFVEHLKPLPIASVESHHQRLVGNSASFNRMLELISRVGPTEASVLLLGESGTGKELVASALHECSQRADKPLVTLECSGLTESLFESEMFGHAKGAFTGANYTKQGLVEAADGGTLFLDEVGDIPYLLQVKLLRLLETGLYRSVGSTQPRRSDFRLLCATHKNLWQMVEEGTFRQDLYYRINVFPIHVPSLAERTEDIPAIAKALLSKISPHSRYHMTEPAMTLLKQHHYGGNIRELRNILSRAVVLSNGNLIDPTTLQQCFDTRAGGSGELVNLRSLERDYLTRLMGIYAGDKEKVAHIAGISVRSLYRKLQQGLTS